MPAQTAKPLQVYLKPNQDRALRHLAEREAVSLAELVRRSVDLYLSQIPLEDDPALGIIGLGASELGDLAEKHDHYLVETAKG
jgi:hypothetical protein